MNLLRRIASGFQLLKMNEFSCAVSKCPFCGPTIILKLNADPAGIRCIRCAASTIHLSLGQVLIERGLDIREMQVCEFSASGPYVRYIKNNARSASLSEFSSNVELGSSIDGVRIEDVQRLTYPDESFDLVTHTEVLEHVPDDRMAFSELHRVLKRDGLMIFTVPFSGHDKTTERARKNGETIDYYLDPIYHIDPWQGGTGILAYRDYGRDIASRLEAAGFEEIEIVKPAKRIPLLHAREVVVAKRGQVIAGAHEI